MSLSCRDTATSPLLPQSEPGSDTQVPQEESPRPDLEADSVSVTLTPPPSTPVRPYRFSDHIHRDRHIFLKGASLGIGCGTNAGNSVHAGHDPFPDSSDFIPWSGGSLRRRVCSVDEQGNLFYNGQCVQLGMALGNERLPSLSRVQLGLSSAEWPQQGQHERYPHVHEHHQPVARRRPFNEQLNTYVDTQKRIRSVQCLEDLYHRTPSPIFPYLATPARKRPRPPPRPARVRFQLPQDLHPPALSRNLTGFSFKTKQAPHSGRCLKKPHAQTETGEAGLPSTSATPRKSGDKGSGAVYEERLGSSSDPETELVEARHALHTAQQANSTREYADYFLTKGGHQGSLGRLFESYPKRVLMVHPGRLLRQRTEMVSRSRMRLLQ